jgi:hypothetical protein
MRSRRTRCTDHNGARISKIGATTVQDILSIDILEYVEVDGTVRPRLNDNYAL